MGKMAEACICNYTEPHTLMCSNPLCYSQPDTSTLSKVAACFKAAEGQALPMTNKCLCVWREVWVYAPMCAFYVEDRLAGVFLSLFSLLYETTQSLQLTDTAGWAGQ